MYGESESTRRRDREHAQEKAKKFITSPINYDSNYHLCKYDILAEGAVNNAMKGLMLVTVLNGQECHCE